MTKVRIKLILLGQLPVNLDKTKLTKWKSEAFELVGKIDNYTITNNAGYREFNFSIFVLTLTLVINQNQGDNNPCLYGKLY